MKHLVFPLLFVSLCIFCTASFAAVPLGGLAVAVSPNGRTIVAGGDNRVLYVLDAEKLEVKNRIWLGVCLVDLHFNNDGSVLLAEDTDGTVLALNTVNWEIKTRVQKASQMSVARKANLMAGLDTDYNGYVIRFLSMTDLSEKGRVSFLKGQKVVGLGLDAEGRKLGVLMESVNDDTEPKGAATPQGLTGLALEESRLKNDGKTSLFQVYRVSDGSKLSDHKIYYSPSSSGWKMAFSGDSALLVNYSNVNAKVAPSGEVTLFGLDNSFNYGTGFSPDQNVLMTGGLATGTRTKAADLGKTLFKIAPVPGWPEYFKGFALNADGTAFGSTSAYRIHRIAPNGMVEKSAAVY